MCIAHLYNYSPIDIFNKCIFAQSMAHISIIIGIACYADLMFNYNMPIMFGKRQHTYVSSTFSDISYFSPMDLCSVPLIPRLTTSSDFGFIS